MYIGKITAAIVLMMMTLASLMMPALGDAGEAKGSWNEPPTRATYGYLNGNITNISLSNLGQFRDLLEISATGWNVTTPPQLPQSNGPYFGIFNWSDPGLMFSIQVDIGGNLDQSRPWDLRFTDRYGWNETGGGVVSYLPPSSFYSSVDHVHYIPNGTLAYIPGKVGALSFTIYNGTSTLPLQGVGFTFEKHKFHSTLESGNYTDGSGKALFRNLQMGIDNPQNNLKVTFVKPHFNTADQTGFGRFTLFEGVTTDYSITLMEDPLLLSYSPAEGSIGVVTNKTLVPDAIRLQFYDQMNTSTVVPSTVWMEKGGGAKVPLDYIWDSNKQMLKLGPKQDLQFNTTYRVVVTPRVRDNINSEPLWRTFSTTFTTEKRPAILRGTVYIKGTSDPAPAGTMAKLDGSIPVLLDNGRFNFSNVLYSAFGHNVTIIGPTVGSEEEYLYCGNWKDGIMVQRGDIVDLTGLYVTKRPTRTVNFHVMDEYGSPLEGATMTHLVTSEVKQTDQQGLAVFSDVLMEKSTRFRVSAENFYSNVITLEPGYEDPTDEDVVLAEKLLPVKVFARGDFIVECIPDAVIQVFSYIQMDFEDEDQFKIPMDPDTMTEQNLKIIGPQGNDVTIDITHEEGELSAWKMTPRNDLLYGTNYTVFISERVADQFGGNPLWRDFSVKVITEELDPASISGRAVMNLKGVEGVGISVVKEGQVLASTVTGTNGFYVLDVKMRELQIIDVSIVANGSSLGLNTVKRTGFILSAGGSLNQTDFTMGRLPDWYSVSYIKDELGRMPVDGKITVTFKQALELSEDGSYKENFSMRGHSVVSLSINVSQDLKTVTIDPVVDLDFETDYVLSISDFPEGEEHRELRKASGGPILTGGERVSIQTVLKPIEIVLQSPSPQNLDNVSLTDPISLYFTNYEINRSFFEPMFSIKRLADGKEVENLTFTWGATFRTVSISHDDFEIFTEYEMFVPQGVYGKNRARLKEDFREIFRTEMKSDPSLVVDENFPGRIEHGGQLVISFSNPKAIPLRVVIIAKPAIGGQNGTEIANFTMTPMEQDKSVKLNVQDLEVGEYVVTINVYDTSSGVLLNGYTRTLEVEKEGNGIGTILWVWIVVGVIIILIIGLAVYLYLQSRKKDIEEELKEEFECPECHNLVSAEDTVCPNCGAEFEEEAYKCPKCGHMLESGDEECSECGYDFSDQDKMELEEEDEEEDTEDISEEFEEGEEEEEMEMEEELEEVEDEDEESDD